MEKVRAVSRCFNMLVLKMNGGRHRGPGIIPLTLFVVAISCFSVI